MIQENVVTNICVWNGDVNSWQPPQSATMLIYNTTLTKIWALNEEKTDYVLVNSVGNADIGFTWDGTYCVTNQPKPELPAPVTE